MQTILAVLQTLTGIFLAGFAAIHFLGLSTINFGENILGSYVSHLDKTNPLILVLVFLVIAVIMGHGINGFRVVLRYFKKAPEVHSHIVDTKYRNSIFWYFHFVSGIMMAIMLCAHLAIACLGNHHAITTIDVIKEHLKHNWYFASIIALLSFGIFHTLFGVRTIFVKYHLLPKYQTAIKTALIVTGLIVMAVGIHNLLLFR